MFPTKALLAHVDCPEHQEGRCHRSSCPFGHVARPRAPPEDDGDEDEGEEEEVSHEVVSPILSSTSREVESARNKSAAVTSRSSFLDAIYGSSGDGGGQASKLPRNAYAAKMAAERERDRPGAGQNARPSHMAASTSSSKSSSSSASSPLTPSLNKADPHRAKTAATTILTPPTIARGSHPLQSPTDLTARQKTVASLFTAFSSLYAGLIPHVSSTASGASASSSRKPPSSPDRSLKSERAIYEAMRRVVHEYASENALETERKVFRAAGINRSTYRNSAVTSMVGINKRKTTETKKADDEKEKTTSLGQAKDGEESIRELGRRACLAAIGNEEEMESCIRVVLDASPLIGTGDEVEIKLSARAKRAQGTLTRQRLIEAGFVVPQDVLRKQGYPIPARDENGGDLESCIERAWGPGGVEPDGAGKRATCDHCQGVFEVMSLDEEDLPDMVEDDVRQKLRESKLACIYHWGKKRYMKDSARGPRIPRWTCCNAQEAEATVQSTRLSAVAQDAGIISTATSVEIGGGGEGVEAGCSRGPHVFKEDKVEELHRREAFHVASAKVSPTAALKHSKPHDILALDCELVYTTSGMSLARVTVLDEAGRVILDLYVRPRASVLDYNTRFSGIKPSNLATDSAVSLRQAREQLSALMHRETILVGHGLENDLAALRLVHEHVVDSVFLFRHPKGLPYRLGLRELTEKKLGILIQRGNAEQGHDAAEDASAALELVRWKLLNEPEDIPILRPPKGADAASVANGSSAHIDETTDKSKDMDQEKGNTKTLPTRAAPSGPSAKATASLFMPKASNSIVRRT